MADEPKTFADHPKSITEIKGERAELAIEWSPRDALIATLRAIDSGELIIGKEIVIIAERQTDDKLIWIRKAGEPLKVAGLLAHALVDI